MTRLLFSLLLLATFNAFAWDGYDYEKGSYVEIEKGQLVRKGREIEVYDYGTGAYRDVEVESIKRVGSKIEIEVTDSATGELRTLEMDD